MDIALPLLQWYDRNKRTFSFRGTRDPYRIWVSEIMLQQTGTATVEPYYRRFIEKYPDIDTLSAAPEQEVMKMWEGLGYYSRARNLLQCARLVQEEYGGRFPEKAGDLKKLPGIGAYTAAAIASIAFDERVPAMDGNLYRVFARLSRTEESIDRPETKAALYALALSSFPDRRCGDMNQALMDLGATVCVPGTPDCSLCPLRPSCLAGDLAAELPRRDKKKAPVLEEQWVFLCTLPDGRIAVTFKETGLLKGLYLFPMASRAGEEMPPEEKAQAGLYPLARARHVFTHRIWDMAVCHTPYREETATIRRQKVKWVSREQLVSLPLPGAMRIPLQEALTLI